MNSTRSFRRLGLLLVVGSAAMACYSQQPLRASAPAPATRIVAQVTDTGRVLMANRIGAAALEVEGVVAAADETTWDLNMLQVSYIGGTSVVWNRELVRFPRYTLTEVSEKRLDRTRTWTAAGAIALGALALVKVFGSAFGDDVIIAPPPVPPAVVLPGGSP